MMPIFSTMVKDSLLLPSDLSHNLITIQIIEWEMSVYFYILFLLTIPAHNRKVSINNPMQFDNHRVW